MLETYSYAGDGKRRQKVSAGSTTNYLWDQENVLAELDGNRVTQAQYTQLPGEWGGLVSQRRSGASSFYGFDLAGNTRALLSPAAGVTDRYRYKAFGDELPPSGTTTNPNRYCGVLGYQRDSATRHYVRARHLGVTAGRWLSRDPGGPDGYLYAANNPLAFEDPDGLRLRRKHGGSAAQIIPIPDRFQPGVENRCQFAQGVLRGVKSTGNPCSCPHPKPMDLNLVVCLFWQETNLGTTGQLKGNYGTLNEDALIQLDTWDCNPKHYRRNPTGDQADLASATDAERIALSYYYLSCVGSLRKYGPDYAPGKVMKYGKDLITRLKECARCLKREQQCPIILVKELYPCSICLAHVHDG